jgi:hypothetical protein
MDKFQKTSGSHMCYVCQYTQKGHDIHVVVTAQLAAPNCYFLKSISIVSASISIGRETILKAVLKM